MSWLKTLYETYNNCMGMEGLIPPYHMHNNTQIEVIIDGDGNFHDAKREELKDTVIPCTEESEATRTNNPPPHPLCDKIQFVAKDYVGAKKSYFEKYNELIDQWAKSAYSHPFVKAIYQYVKKGTLYKDLKMKGILEKNEDAADLFVRWIVEIPGVLESKCWQNQELFQSWERFCTSFEGYKSICYVKGENLLVAFNHPKKIRNSADGAKLISSNDNDGFTFRGKFYNDSIVLNGKSKEVTIQPVTVSVEVSQKAHRALSWLIKRQGFKNGDQVIVSWAVSGSDVPSFLEDQWEAFGYSSEERIAEVKEKPYTDAGQAFASRLNLKIKGYNVKISSTDKIAVLGLDSAVPGRLAVTYYRELSGSEFLKRIEQWYLQMRWHYWKSVISKEDNKSKIQGYVIMTPSVAKIAEAAYGYKRDDDFKKYKKSILERFLPCIIDSTPIPVDILNAVVHKVSNPLAYPTDKHWMWEEALSIACSLYRCYSLRNINPKIEYNMALENERNDRDYLYGRLLAIAEHLEQIALSVAKEQRETTATRLMQRFADHPFSTWRNIELALRPYISRLQVNRSGFLYNMQKLLDEIHSKFNPGEYENDSRLSGLYLLGYHCQRLELKSKKDDNLEIIEN